MQANAQQKQNIQEAIFLLRDFANKCPILAPILNQMADSNTKLLSNQRVFIETPGSGGILDVGETAQTSIEYAISQGRYFISTFAMYLFPGRNLNRKNCADLTHIIKIMGTLTHETYHRRCHKDPQAYIMNIGLLTAMQSCLNPEQDCYHEFKAAFESEIASETTALSASDQCNEYLRKWIFSGGIGMLVFGLAIKAGLTSVIVGGATSESVIGMAGGLPGVLVGLFIGAGTSVLAYRYFDPCESP